MLRETALVCPTLEKPVSTAHNNKLGLKHCTGAAAEHRRKKQRQNRNADKDLHVFLEVGLMCLLSGDEWLKIRELRHQSFTVT